MIDCALISDQHALLRVIRCPRRFDLKRCPNVASAVLLAPLIMQGATGKPIHREVDVHPSGQSHQRTSTFSTVPNTLIYQHAAQSFHGLVVQHPPTHSASCLRQASTPHLLFRSKWPLLRARSLDFALLLSSRHLDLYLLCSPPLPISWPPSPSCSSPIV